MRSRRQMGAPRQGIEGMGDMGGIRSWSITSQLGHPFEDDGADYTPCTAQGLVRHILAAIVDGISHVSPMRCPDPPVHPPVWPTGYWTGANAELYQSPATSHPQCDLGSVAAGPR